MTTMAAVCDEQAFILGARVSDFENDLHRYIARRMPLARPGPILLALMAAGVKHGDEVVTVAYTFCATAGSILRFGAKPIFVDIKPDSFNIDPAAIEAAHRRERKPSCPFISSVNAPRWRGFYRLPPTARCRSSRMPLELTADQQAYVVETIKQFYRSH